MNLSQTKYVNSSKSDDIAYSNFTRWKSVDVPDCDKLECGCGGIRCVSQSNFTMLTVLTIMFAIVGILTNGIAAVVVLTTALRHNANT